MKKLICYCFGYSEADIIKDVQQNHGHSLIMERIQAEKKKGSCNCSATNPLGR
ncbi:MAG: BFD-like (2Fe-2S) protein [Nitrospiraceae bacterium]|nr:MAG: BFD-like (2Fe-2S) protein [Nitrospiraceae bacterium]